MTSNEIHLWLAFSDDVTEHTLREYRELLSDEEREQEARFRFEKDRRRYRITRALVRTTLSRYVSLDPRDWRFEANQYGRPEIANAEAKGLSFNVSHTHGLVVLGVTRNRALGVDVENFRAREVSIDIAHHFFAPQEVEALAAIPPGEQQYRFFEYWTFKETYIKARGMGLSLPLDKFRFHYPHDRGVAIVIDPELADDAARWQFWQFRPGPDYLVAMCSERNAEPPSVVIRKAVPMRSEETLTAEFLRVSHEW